MKYVGLLLAMPESETGMLVERNLVQGGFSASIGRMEKNAKTTIMGLYRGYTRVIWGLLRR